MLLKNTGFQSNTHRIRNLSNIFRKMFAGVSDQDWQPLEQAINHWIRTPNSLGLWDWPSAQIFDHGLGAHRVEFSYRQWLGHSHSIFLLNKSLKVTWKCFWRFNKMQRLTGLIPLFLAKEESYKKQQWDYSPEIHCESNQIRRPLDPRESHALVAYQAREI